MNFRDFLKLRESIIKVDDRNVYKIPISKDDGKDLIKCLKYYINKFLSTGDEKFFLIIKRIKNVETMKSLGYNPKDINDIKEFVKNFFKLTLTSSDLTDSYGGKYLEPSDYNGTDKANNKVWMFEFKINDFMNNEKVSKFVKTENLNQYQLKRLEGKDLYYKVTFIDTVNSTETNKIFAKKLKNDKYIYFDQQTYGVYDISVHF